MLLLLVLIALFIGMLLPLQAGINAQLRQWVGHPLLAAMVSFATGAALLLAASIAARAPFSGLSRLAEVPWQLWLGGLLGANYVFMAILLAPRLGAAALIALTVTG